MSKAKNEIEPIGEIDHKLTLGERVALAFASQAIFNLPRFLQQFNNAEDMQMMLTGAGCGRGGYLLLQALSIFDSASGFREGALDGDLNALMTEACKKYVAKVIKQNAAILKADAEETRLFGLETAVNDRVATNA